MPDLSGSPAFVLALDDVEPAALAGLVTVACLAAAPPAPAREPAADLES